MLLACEFDYFELPVSGYFVEDPFIHIRKLPGYLSQVIHQVNFFGISLILNQLNHVWRVIGGSNEQGVLESFDLESLRVLIGKTEWPDKF